MANCDQNAQSSTKMLVVHNFDNSFLCIAYLFYKHALSFLRNLPETPRKVVPLDHFCTQGENRASSRSRVCCLYSHSLGYFYSLDGMLVHRRVTPSNEYPSTHLYVWVKRGTVKVVAFPRTQLNESACVTCCC